MATTKVACRSGQCWSRTVNWWRKDTIDGSRKVIRSPTARWTASAGPAAALTIATRSSIRLSALAWVVVGERANFEGNSDFLAERGVDVVLLDDPECIDLMARFIRERPGLWNEDIAEEG